MVLSSRAQSITVAFPSQTNGTYLRADHSNRIVCVSAYWTRYVLYSAKYTAMSSVAMAHGNYVQRNKIYDLFICINFQFVILSVIRTPNGDLFTTYSYTRYLRVVCHRYFSSITNRRLEHTIRLCERCERSSSHWIKLTNHSVFDGMLFHVFFCTFCELPKISSTTKINRIK